MNKTEFESCINVAYWQAEVGQEAFVNTWSVKGPVIILRNGEPFAVWTDRKTPGYPLEVIVGTLVLTGGNWQGESYPLDVLRREREEELTVGSKALGLTLTPFKDYFIGIPAATLHQTGRRGYCDCSSVYVAEVDEERLYDAMKIQKRDIPRLIQALNLASTESEQVITLVDDLRRGRCSYAFGFGDGKKLFDILENKYVVKIKFQDLEGVHVVSLSSLPSEPFESRREVLEAYLRRGNNPFFGRVTDANVFGR